MPGNEQLIIDIGVQLGDAVSKLNELGSKVNGLETSMQSAQPKGDSFFGGILGFGAKAGLAITGIGGLAMGIGGLASSMFDGNATMESYNTQFEVMTGSAQNAATLMGQLQTMGAKTPFEFTDLAGATQTLLAFGRTQKDIIPDLQMLGDISGGNKEKMNSLSLVYGQVASQGKMMGGDLLQMINAGFNPLNIISQKTGKSMSELRDEMAKGQISFDMVQDAMKTATSQGGQFFGMMDKQSGTFQGLTSTLADNFHTLERTLMAPIFDKVKDGLNGLVNFLGSPGVVGAISNLADLVSNGLGGAFDFLGKVFTAFQGNGQPLLDFFTSLGGPGSPMAAFGTFIVNIIANVQAFIGALQSGQNPLEAFGNLVGGNLGALGNLLGNVLGWVTSTGLPLLMQKLGEWGMALINWVGPQIPPLLGKLGELLGSLLGWIFGTALPAILDQLGTWAQAFIEWVGPQIPPLLGKLAELLGSLLAWIWNDALPVIIQKLGEWGKAFIDWVGPRILPMLGELGKILLAIGQWVIGTALPAIVSHLAEWGGAFIGWVGKDALPFIVQKLGEFGQAVWTWIINDALPGIIQKLGEWGKAFIGWVGKDALPFIGQKLGEFAQAIWNWITTTAGQIPGKVLSIGQGLVDGIRNGIQGAWQGLVNWLSGLVKDALPGFIKDWLGIKSPSTVMAGIAEQIPAGLKAGIDAQWGQVTGTLSSNLQNTSDATNTNAQALDWEQVGRSIISGMALVVSQEFDKSNQNGLLYKFNDGLDRMFQHLNEAWGPQTLDRMNVWLLKMDNAVHSLVDDMVNYWNSRMDDFNAPQLPPVVGDTGGTGTGGSGGGGGGGGGGGAGAMRPITGGGGTRQNVYVQVVVQDHMGNQRDLSVLSVNQNDRTRIRGAAPSVVSA